MGGNDDAGDEEHDSCYLPSTKSMGPREREAQFVSLTAIKQYSRAMDFADNDSQREQTIANAILCGDYRCAKKSGALDRMDSSAIDRFVKEKVLPFTPIIECNGRFSLDEGAIFEALGQLGGDPCAHIRDALTRMDLAGFDQPLKKWLLALHSKDQSFIETYQDQVAQVPERTDIEGLLHENGIKIVSVVQAGDTKRYYPKDGFLYLAELDGRKIIVKELLKQHTDSSRLDGVTREAEILQALEHPCIAGYRGQLIVDDHRFMLEEYIEQKPKPTGLAAVIDEAEQITSAYLHMVSRGVLYLDFKGKNILYDGSHYKMVDFGWAQFCDGEATTDLSTPRYMAPETVLRCKADQRSDVFGLGIYLFERLTGHHPFALNHVCHHNEEQSILHYSKANILGELSDKAFHIQEPYGKLIRSMLERDPANRPDFLAIERSLDIAAEGGIIDD